MRFIIFLLSAPIAWFLLAAVLVMATPPANAEPRDILWPVATPASRSVADNIESAQPAYVTRSGSVMFDLPALRNGRRQPRVHPLVGGGKHFRKQLIESLVHPRQSQME